MSALLLALLLCAVSCGKGGDDSDNSVDSVDPDKYIVTIEDVSGSQAVVCVSFGKNYADNYVSVTVLDNNGDIGYLTQLQLDTAGYGEAEIYTASPGIYTVETVSGKISKSVKFEREE